MKASTTPATVALLLHSHPSFGSKTHFPPSSSFVHPGIAGHSVAASGETVIHLSCTCEHNFSVSFLLPSGFLFSPWTASNLLLSVDTEVVGTVLLVVVVVVEDFASPLLSGLSDSGLSALSSPSPEDFFTHCSATQVSPHNDAAGLSVVV